jgi:hypothetical protein
VNGYLNITALVIAGVTVSISLLVITIYLLSDGFTDQNDDPVSATNTGFPKLTVVGHASVLTVTAIDTLTGIDWLYWRVRVLLLDSL